QARPARRPARLRRRARCRGGVRGRDGARARTHRDVQRRHRRAGQRRADPPDARAALARPVAHGGRSRARPRGRRDRARARRLALRGARGMAADRAARAVARGHARSLASSGPTELRRSTSVRRDHPGVPNLDEARQRLVRRFGDGVHSWMDELPGRLLVIRERWSLELDSALAKGSMSVVLRCRTAQGERAILKICPDRERVAKEIAGLIHWSTPHVPTVLRADPSMGALLMEEIEPGTPLQDSGTYPALGEVAQILTALHAQGTSDGGFPSLADRV